MTELPEPTPLPDATPPRPESDAAAHERAMERLDPRVVPYWIVSGLFGVLVLAGLAFGALALFGDRLPGDRDTWLVVVIAGTALFVGGQLAIPSLAWRRWRWSIDDELLLARYGVVFHEEKAIPVSRLQHVDLTRGPIERLFGLATLVVHTAGTEGASFRLPGLAAGVAAELRDRILEARGDDVV